MIKSPASTDEQITQAILLFTTTLLDSGIPHRQIERTLMHMGVSLENAATIVMQLASMRAYTIRRAAFRRVMMGGLTLLLGLIVMLGIYYLAFSGMLAYAIAWVTILGGGYYFFKGLLLYSEV